VRGFLNPGTWPRIFFRILPIELPETRRVANVTASSSGGSAQSLRM
jgi:hypothetical protein